MLSQELMETLMLERELELERLLAVEEVRRMQEVSPERPRARQQERPDHDTIRVRWFEALSLAD